MLLSYPPFMGLPLDPHAVTNRLKAGLNTSHTIDLGETLKAYPHHAIRSSSIPTDGTGASPDFTLADKDCRHRIV